MVRVPDMDFKWKMLSTRLSLDVVLNASESVELLLHAIEDGKLLHHTLNMVWRYDSVP